MAGVIEERESSEEHRDAILTCFRKGWIHADLGKNGVSYLLPSPLHWAYISWNLMPVTTLPCHSSLLTFTIDVITHFKC
jgi:hypothetical protein